MSCSNAAAFDLGLLQAPCKDRPALACKACNKRGLDEQYPDHEREYRVLASREQLARSPIVQPWLFLHHRDTRRGRAHQCPSFARRVRSRHSVSMARTRSGVNGVVRSRTAAARFATSTFGSNASM